ncbi:hypothetical protein C9374_006473 [Naegleria lovaniensis]|uniref:tRNA pseudouridine synthase n=1 Tax=Naegleria lovaniensis TaxID=51637 RepID=A0AA88KH80_NAELO|nr:uncharacterized protein C9374_006473 [Naegleria lovaniensis]KAG2381484.1 hypothetical protein C9374_006473 [Naegleria lovaniensis]
MTKRRILAYVGYCGFGLKGSQIQLHVAPEYTIEGIIAKKLFKHNLVKESNYVNPDHLRLDRSTRTDKGVHSLANLISLKVESSVDRSDEHASEAFADYIQQVINSKSENESNLDQQETFPDPQLQAFRVEVVSRRINTRGLVSIRGYEYILPFQIMLDLVKRFDTSPQQEDKIFELLRMKIRNEDIPRLKGEEEKNTLLLQAICEKLNYVLNQFEGFQSFHNFTVSSSSNDGEPMTRQIYHCYASPARVKCDSNHQEEWAIRFKLAGNGFVQHQIRKMISSAVLHVIAPEIMNQEFLDIALLSNEDVYINKVPGEHLIHTRSVLNDPDMEQRFSNCREQQIQFKKTILYPKIFKEHRALLEEHWLKYAREVLSFGNEWLTQKEQVKSRALQSIEAQRLLQLQRREKDVKFREDLLSQQKLLPDRAIPNGYRSHFYSKFKLYPQDERAIKAISDLATMILSKKLPISSNFELLDEAVVSEKLLDPNEIQLDEEL